MNIEARVVDIGKEPCDLLVLWGEQKDQPIDEAGQSIDRLADDVLSAALAVSDFQGKLGGKLVVYPRNGISAKRLMLVGLGKLDDFDLEALREAAGAAAREANALRAQDVLMSIPSLTARESTESERTEALVVGASLGLYRYQRNSTSHR